MLSGSCLCGAIRYEIDGKIGPVGHCHCVTCRKAQGGAFVTNAVFLSHLRLTSVEPSRIGARDRPDPARAA
jgi:hypothetical protein